MNITNKQIILVSYRFSPCDAGVLIVDLFGSSSIALNTNSTSSSVIHVYPVVFADKSKAAEILLKSRDEHPVFGIHNLRLLHSKGVREEVNEVG